METLMQLGADVNIGDEYGNTPLHLAIADGHTKCVASLMANPKIMMGLRNAKGLTQLQVAHVRGQKDIIDILEREEHTLAKSIKKISGK